MNESDSEAQFDLFLVRDFLDEHACEEIAAEMRAAGGVPATVYGTSASAAVDERMRKVSRILPSTETVAAMRQRLLSRRSELESHFGIKLGECEEPQFLRYTEGDFFVAHQDGNTGLLRSEQESRRVSVVIFLSREADAPQPGMYCGGSLVFSDWRRDARLRLAGKQGTLVAFRSETTHEVTPVLSGERLTVACWFS